MFNWWTFLFQLVNFFVVLYILYRLFFKPLKRVIQAREEMINDRLEKLDEGEARIKEEEARYRAQTEEIAHLREKEIAEARKEGLIEKDALLKESEAQIAKAMEKQRKIADHQREQSEKEIRRKSLEFSLHYSEQLLTRLSDELLHRRRTEQFLRELPLSGVKEIAQLKGELAGKPCEIALQTPFEPDQEMLAQIEQSMRTLLGCESVRIESTLAPELIAGIRLSIRNKLFDASLKGELERFKSEMESEL